MGTVLDILDPKPMPYRFVDGGKFFSRRTSSGIERSNILRHNWLVAVYLSLTHPKTVGSV